MLKSVLFTHTVYIYVKIIKILQSYENNFASTIGILYENTYV